MKLGNLYTVKYHGGRVDCDVPGETIARGGLHGVADVKPCIRRLACAPLPGQPGRCVAIKYTTSNTTITLARLDTVAEAARMIDALQEMEQGDLVALLGRFDPDWLRRGEPVWGVI